MSKSNQMRLVAKGLGTICPRHFHTNLGLGLLYSSRQILDRGEKVSINLITIGDSGHGKTVLNSHLSKTFSSTYKSVEDFDKGSTHSGSHKCTHFEWEDGEKFRFNHSDVPGLPNYAKSLGTHLFQMDAAVLVIDASKGITLTGKNHYFLFKHASSNRKHGLVIPLVNLTSSDDSENDELKVLALDELRDFMSSEEVSRVVVGSVHSSETLQAVVDEIVKLFNPDVIHRNSSDLAKLPLYWPLENVGDIPNRGMFWAGRLQSGILKKGDKVTLHQGTQVFPAFVRDIEIFQKQTSELYPGERGGAFVRFKSEEEIRRGAFVLGEKGILPHKDSAWSSGWEVHLKPLPTSTTPIKVRKENGIFHMTLNDPVVSFSEERELKPSEEFKTAMRSRHKLLARPGDPFIVNRDRTSFLIGQFLHPLPSD